MTPKTTAMDGLTPADIEIVETLVERYLIALYKTTIKEEGEFGRFPKELNITPQQIAAFLQRSREYKDPPEAGQTLPHYLSKILKQSHRFGHNDFQLNLREITPPFPLYKNISYGVDGYLSDLLIATPERPLKATVRGNLGFQCANNSRNVSLTITGNVNGAFGQLCYNSSFDVKYAVFVDSPLSGKSFHQSCDCTYRLGHLSTLPKDPIEEVDHCTFAADNRRTIEKLLVLIPSGNRIIHLDGDRETVVRDYEGGK